MNQPSKYKDIKLISAKNIVWRRMVYIFFVIIFLIVTPIILLYTQGYRYDFQKGRVQKTGILIISSIPKKANIYLNEKIIKDNTTPAKLERLLPADYEIKLSKEGYYDWNKRLQIFENSTTFAEDVILWKHNLPIQLEQYEVIDWLSSPNNKKSVFITHDRKIISFDFDNHRFNEIYKTGQYDNPQIINWSNTDKKVLLKSGGKYIVINTERSQDQPITIKNRNYTLVKWDLKNDNIIYGLNSLGIWKIDLFTQKDELIFDQYVSDFLIDDETIYYFNNNIVYKRKTYESKNPEIIDGIKCSECKFENKLYSKIILLDHKNQNLFIIDESGKNKTIKVEASDISWLNDNTMLFYNNWEIWIYKIDKNEPEIITRIGAGIGEAKWHPGGRHIIFISENKIKIIELDNRELRNMIELFSGNTANNLTIDNKGEHIYFNETLANKGYIMDLTIK